MKQRFETIGWKAGQYITRLFARSLSPDLIFHNFLHTAMVVRAATEIGKASGLVEEQLEILILAAWFHDSGYTETYENHEESSCGVAGEWLSQQGYAKENLDNIYRCIMATRVPQEPTSILEEVLCDADMYHLAHRSYVQIQFQLREEWRRCMNREFTDYQWMQDNVKFLRSHQYWTRYGKEELTKRKKENLELCVQLLVEYSKLV